MHGRKLIVSEEKKSSKKNVFYFASPGQYCQRLQVYRGLGGKNMDVDLHLLDVQVVLFGRPGAGLALHKTF